MNTDDPLAEFLRRRKLLLSLLQEKETRTLVYDTAIRATDGSFLMLRYSPEIGIQLVEMPDPAKRF